MIDPYQGPEWFQKTLLLLVLAVVFAWAAMMLWILAFKGPEDLPVKSGREALTVFAASLGAAAFPVLAVFFLAVAVGGVFA